MSRTFTLREAAALAALVEPGAGAVEDEPAARARRFVAALAAARARRRAGPGEDDVPDPIRGPASLHEEAAQLIVAALLPLLRRLGDELCGRRSPGAAPTIGGTHAQPPS